MFNLSVRSVMDKDKTLTLGPGATVSEAALQMAEKNTGAAMVVDGERLVGIFTERDALFRVIARGLDARRTQLADVMTPDPKTIDAGKSYGHALVMMQENGFRHAPVIDNGKPIGMISSRNAMDPDLEEFASEVQRRKVLSAER